MLPEQTYGFEAELWRSGDGKAAWTFLTVPREISQQIRFMAGKTNGFGSVPVRARIGDKNWKTSLFPDKASGCYFLPVKAEVRRAQAISAGDRVSAELFFG
jgi:hypothetical protein